MGWNLSRKCDYVDQELCSCFLIRRCCRRRYENVLQPSLRVGLLIGQVLSPSGNPACLMGREINARRVLVCVSCVVFAIDQPSLRVDVLILCLCRVIASLLTLPFQKTIPRWGIIVRLICLMWMMRCKRCKII